MSSGNRNVAPAAGVRRLRSGLQQVAAGARVRLFVALPVPASPVYGQVTQDLVAAAPSARPVPDGAWHITVRFLGEVFDAAPVAAALDAACKGRPALPCVVEGLGT